MGKKKGKSEPETTTKAAAADKGTVEVAATEKAAAPDEKAADAKKEEAKGSDDKAAAAENEAAAKKKAEEDAAAKKAEEEAAAKKKEEDAAKRAEEKAAKDAEKEKAAAEAKAAEEAKKGEWQDGAAKKAASHDDAVNEEETITSADSEFDAQLLDLFNLLDSDGNGYLVKKELSSAMKAGPKRNKFCDAYLRDLDSDKDDKISRNEWLTWFFSKSEDGNHKEQIISEIHNVFKELNKSK